MVAEPTDLEAPLRAKTIQELSPWFCVSEEVPVMLRDGRSSGRVDVLAIPKDARFSKFAFAIEEKCARDMTYGLAARIRQAADYAGSTVIGTGVSISRAFINLTAFEYASAADFEECHIMMRVAHQFFVGGLYRDRGSLRFASGPDDLWRQHPFIETGDNWPGRAMERLTSKRQSAGSRRHAGEVAAR